MRKMPPTVYIAQKVKQLSCNGSDVIIFWLPNTTSVGDDDGADGYDSAGAMKFIITTLLVYSLLGISGMLLLRIRRRASRTHRVVTLREEDLQQYIKRADDLKMAGHRYKLRMEATRMVRYLHNLETQKSITSNDTSPEDESASLLSPVFMTAQDIPSINTPKVLPKKCPPSFSIHKKVALPPLPEYYNDVTWHTSRSRTSLCKTCIALSGSSKKSNTENASTDKQSFAWRNDAGGEKNETETIDEQQENKS